jgi:hypothetical protein
LDIRQQPKKEEAMTLVLSEQNNLEISNDPNNREVIDVEVVEVIDVEGPDGGQPPPVDESSRRGRNILLGFGALGLIVIGTAAAIALPHVNDGTGDRTYHPTTFAELDHEYEFGIGSLKVDLRDVDFPPGTHVITVDHGIGSAQVLLPADVDYDVTGDITAGDLDVLGESEDGFNNDLNAQSATNATTTVIVDLEVDIGYGRVRQG